MRQESSGLREAGLRPAPRRPDQALWRRWPAELGHIGQQLHPQQSGVDLSEHLDQGQRLGEDRIGPGLDVEFRTGDSVHDARLPEGYAKVQEEAEVIRTALRSSALELVPCHNDPAPENLVYTRSRAHIPDWEFAGNNDPFWDIADLSVEPRCFGVQNWLWRRFGCVSACKIDPLRWGIGVQFCPPDVVLDRPLRGSGRRGS